MIAVDTITDKDVAKLLSLVDEGLANALLPIAPGQHSLEDAMQITVGYPFDNHSAFDDDEAAPSLLSLFSTADWSSNEARAKGMRRFAVASIGADRLPCDRWMDRLFVNVIQNDIATAASHLCAKAPSDALRIALEAAAARCKADGDKAAVSALREAADRCLDALPTSELGGDVIEGFAHLEHCADTIGHALEMGEPMYAINNLFFACADAFVATLRGRGLSEDAVAGDAALARLANAAADAFLAAGSAGSRFMHLTAQ